MDQSFSIVVAVDLKNGIGRGGTLPWNLPEDLKHFKTITATTQSPQNKNVVVMGRKTWESLPERFKPLPNRINMVLTKNKGLRLPQGVLCCDSLDAVIGGLAQSAGTYEHIFVIGGGEIFKQTLAHPNCRRVYVTKILKDFQCDTFFPVLEKNWSEVNASQRLRDGSVEYYFTEYVPKIKSL